MGVFLNSLERKQSFRVKNHLVFNAPLVGRYVEQLVTKKWRVYFTLFSVFLFTFNLVTYFFD